MSLHPAHLIDSSGSLTTAALIPFCTYQTDMTLLGQTSPAISSVVCSTFQPTVLEGQLCYALNLTSIGTEKAKTGQRNGLTIFIDQGTANVSQNKSGLFIDRKEGITKLDLELSEDDDNSARIYLNTLSSFTDSRVGSYAMSSLKKMTGTDSFLAQTEEQKNCRIQTQEDCQAERYLDNVQRECGCVPWALRSALTKQVFTQTRRYSPLRRLSSCSCGGLWPLSVAFFCPAGNKKNYVYFFAYFRPFLVFSRNLSTFRSNLCN